MGIPSYYKKLIDTVPGLLAKNHPIADISWLFMDFNCLIYHCLHREDTPIYPGDHLKDEWELQFIDCIITYCLKVIHEVDPLHGVFIAIDGVVPMAKMRQQRLRRFKSAWLARQSDTSTTAVATNKWDTNSITPGTAFMTKLRTRLQTMITKHSRDKTWLLSSSDEPGEGEHKIIAQWRTGTYAGNFAVYGLDADLIVLSILGSRGLNNCVWLFREEVTAGKISYDDNGEEIFEWFSINTLVDWLAAEFSIDANKRRAFIMNYCFAMTVLGNDFLPTSLGLKIRDDGHAELLDIIRNLTSRNTVLVDSDSHAVSFNGLIELFGALAPNEETRICKYITKKMMFARNLEHPDGPPLPSDNNWPLFHVEEEHLINRNQLCTSWQEKYMSSFFGGITYTKNNVERACSEYLYGVQWIWAYYMGQMDAVCFNWYYPFALPPLWQWLHSYLVSKRALPSFPNSIQVQCTDIAPVEQLSLVLPLESWALIPQCHERMLPKLAPHFFPDVFSFDSVGKRYFWECESLIPLPSIAEVKAIISRYKLSCA